MNTHDKIKSEIYAEYSEILATLAEMIKEIPLSSYQNNELSSEKDDKPWRIDFIYICELRDDLRHLKGIIKEMHDNHGAEIFENLK